MTLPDWLASYAGLDDDALAVLANRGLVRRATKEAVRIELDAAAAASVTVRYVGTPPAQVTLLPGGPKQARCSCPVAGVCVHLVAACVWARDAAGSSGETSPVEPSMVEPVETSSVEAGGESSSGAVAAPPGEGSPQARPADSARPAEGSRQARPADSARPAEGSRQARPADSTDEGSRPAVLDELLALDPLKVNRSAGIAAVRRVAEGVGPSPTTIEPRSSSLRLAWPGSPEIVAVAGGGFDGLLVGGSHSDVTERAWRLEALVRLFAAHQKAWVWPGSVHAVDVIQPGQTEAMTFARDSIEALLRGGLARVGATGADRLTASAQRARLEALPLLAMLLTQAAGRASGVAARSDEASERDLLTALAKAWALATALLGAAAPLPPHLVGGERGPGESAEVGTLVPLGLRWWHSASGARGLSATFVDLDHGRLETATTGRAAGADPSFTRSWETPLLWGASASMLAAGRLTLTGAERRDDGTLSPTTRTRAVAGERFEIAPLAAEQLAEAVASAISGRNAAGFLPQVRGVRVVLPRRLLGLAEPELDEVAQQLVWPVTDRSGRRHQVRVDATGAEQAVIGWLLRDNAVAIDAVLVDDSAAPIGVYITDKGVQRFVSPTMTPPRYPVQRGWWARRREQQRQGPRAWAGEEGPPPHPIGQVAASVLDVCEALAATGRPALSPRQADTLRQRLRTASDLGLSSLAAAVERLLAAPGEPGAVLRATVVADRTVALVPDAG